MVILPGSLNLTVHRLLKDILDKSSYWSGNATEYEVVNIGKTKFVPRPYTTDLLKIKLSDQIGKQVFDLAKENLLSSNTDWINIVKGLVIIPGKTDNGAILGFKIGGDSCSVQLHYHTPLVSGYQKDSAIFKVTASYNQIQGNYAGSQLAKMPANKHIALPSAQSGNLAFLQAGMGNMIRVDLPFLKHYKSLKNTAVNRAYLRIRPFRPSVTNALRVPQALYVYRCDKNNQFYVSGDGTPLPLYYLAAASQATGVSSRYIYDYVANDEYYLLDLTAYATEMIASETDDVGGLIIRSGPFSSSSSYRDADTEFSKSVDRLVVANQHHSQPGVKLEFYYTYIKQ
ncbi:hypothetical protein MUK70_14520 [Dyadobacter chenwenxiniae]|uniref:DUF4270 family protein n=1 Tax=Dyadobacter chenwenxiniae TaxID=2906456 RepID=UPI001FCFC882|nr:DUF4270 family protein [Dyadobacter chenwenxiniae]UON86187.1 hypothetical protein MUK70_14520 [Dyadobacter chenwenxiniae]